MVLFLQFVVRFAVGQVFGALSRRGLVAAATRFGATTSGVGFRARTFLAGELIGNQMADFIIDDLAPRMRDSDNWSREAALALAQDVLDEVAAEFQGPYPEKLVSRSGETLRNIVIDDRGETVAIGTRDPWPRWFETRDDTRRWRARRWLEPAMERAIRAAPDLYVQALQRAVRS